MITDKFDVEEFMSNKDEEQILTNGILKLVTESDTFSFLKIEEDIYSVNDLKD